MNKYQHFTALTEQATGLKSVSKKLSLIFLVFQTLKHTAHVGVLSSV